MSVANNQRFKAGPTYLLTTPLIISDNENAEFTTGAGAVVSGGKTAGEGHSAVTGNLRTAGVARTGVLRFDGLEGRAQRREGFFRQEDQEADLHQTGAADLAGRRRPDRGESLELTLKQAWKTSSI